MSNLSAELVSLLQGASNGAASQVSAPVDTLAALLRRAGLPIPGNALGGSEWMRQAGFVVPPEKPLAGAIGEGLGLAAPIGAIRLKAMLGGGP
jgi:hypothetical protein